MKMEKPGAFAALTHAETLNEVTPEALRKAAEQAKHLCHELQFMRVRYRISGRERRRGLQTSLPLMCTNVRREILRRR